MQTEDPLSEVTPPDPLSGVTPSDGIQKLEENLTQMGAVSHAKNFIFTV